MIKIISWNVNGIRAVARKGFTEIIEALNPDIVCLQETKASPDQLENSLKDIPGYTAHFEYAERKGYSGVALYTKTTPRSITTLGIPEFDNEGRTIIAEYPSFTLVNGYFPNSQAEGKRLDYKLAYCNAIWQYIDKLREKGTNVLLCGDMNIAHKPIDLARPKQNEQNPGYLPEERDWMTRFLDSGYIDIFRYYNKEPENYTWWSYRGNARENNVGWRLDYFIANQALMAVIKDMQILSNISASDHCPVILFTQ